MDDIHPVRIWRLEKEHSKVLDMFRDTMAAAREKYGGPIDGIQPIEMPMNLPAVHISDFYSLQGSIYKYQESTEFLWSFLKFWDEQRQVFAFDPGLSEALSETEIGDVPWSELKLPHKDFYLSIGDYGQSTFEVGAFEYIIDGAYIRHVSADSVLFPNDTLLFKFTARLIYPSYKEAKEIRAEKGFHFAEPIYDYCISGEGCSTIDEALVRGESEFLTFCDRRDARIYEAAREVAEEFDVVPFGEHLHLTRAKFERGRTMIHDAIPVFFNALFYLTARPENRTEGLPATTPESEAQRYRHTATPSIRKSIEDSLARKGFSKIIFVRDPDVKEFGGGFPGDRKLASSHWRRGHWRRQPHGPALSLLKWIWIRPVLVKASEALKLGSVHEVQSTEKNQ